MGKRILDQNGKVIFSMTELPDGLFAIDLECDEALRLAKYFLPPTGMIMDRPGKPRSRWVYRNKPL
jgi:hypothetical protein